MPQRNSPSDFEKINNTPHPRIASPRTLFQVEASAPLRKHMAILNKDETAPTIIRLRNSVSACGSLSNKTPRHRSLSSPDLFVIEQEDMNQSYSNKAEEKTKVERVIADTSNGHINRRKEKLMDIWKGLSYPNSERASSTSTVRSSVSTTKNNNVIIIDLDDDDDDCGQDNKAGAEEMLHSAIPMKRKLRVNDDEESILVTMETRRGSPQAPAAFSTVRLKQKHISKHSRHHQEEEDIPSETRPRLECSLTSAATSASLGSIYCPVELDSDSESDGLKPILSRPVKRRMNNDAGSTIHEPILITAESTLPTIDSENNGDNFYNWSPGSLQNVLQGLGHKDATSTTSAKNSLQEQLILYRLLQRVQYQTEQGAGGRKRSTNLLDKERSPSVDDLTRLALPGRKLDSVIDSDQKQSQGSFDLFGRIKEGFVLSEAQQLVIEQVVNHGKNVFFTGSAGTGKSVLLRELIERLRAKHSRWADSPDWDSLAAEKVAVTASTGIAACNIGGCTLHSFAGVGLGQDTLPKLQIRVIQNNRAVQRWRNTQVLIVDEVSMVHGELLDKLEGLARFIRGNSKPWGGIQVVLCGDFFQLPPVDKTGATKFCFEAKCWAKTIHATFELQKVFRQKDQSFAEMLDQVRIGRMSAATMNCFRRLNRSIPENDGLRPTELFPLRKQVENANNNMLHKLPGETLVFMAEDRGKLKDRMEQHCIAPTKLEIKVNSQVMLLRNQSGGPGGLVNGSIGVVIAFVTEPAQNICFGPRGELLPSLNMPGERLPKVRFKNDMGDVREMVIGRDEWRIEMPDGEFLGGRIQIPLCLAWALSIHKSQGQTIPKVRVDLGRIFEKGQAYVALSRVTTVQGLQVLNFDPQKVMVHPKVVEFYERVKHATEVAQVTH